MGTIIGAPPIIQNVEISGNILESKSLEGVDSLKNSYIISPEIKINLSGTHQKVYKYKCDLIYQGFDENFNNLSDYKGTVEIGEFNSTTFQIDDVRKYIYKNNPNGINFNIGYRYQIQVTGTNGKNTGNSKTTEEKIITGPPKITKIENDIKEDIFNTENSYFYKRVRPVFKYDEGYNCIIFIARSTFQQKSWTGYLDGTGDSSRYKTFNTSSIEEGARHNIYIQLGYNDNYFGEITLGKALTKVKLPELEGVRTKNNNIFSPLTSTNENITFSKFTTKDFGLYGLDENNLKAEIKIEYNNIVGQIEKTFAESTSSSSLFEIILNQSDINNLFANFDTTENFSASLTLSVTTKYNIKVTSLSVPIEVQYINDTSKPVLNNISFNLAYNNQKPKIWTERCVLTISNITITSAYRPIKFNIYAIKGEINQTISPEWNKNNNQYTLKNSIQITTPQISKNIAASDHKIIITIDTDSGQSISETILGSAHSLPSVKSLTKGSGEIVSATYSPSSKDLKVKMKITDFGTREGINIITDQPNFSTITARIYYFDEENKTYKSMYDSGYGYFWNNKIFNPDQVSSNSKKNTTTFAPSNRAIELNNLSIFKIKIKYVTRIWPLGIDENNITTTNSISQVWWSPEFTVYNLTPTVSYRKNKVGINYDFSGASDDNDVLVIAANGVHKRIRLIDTDLIIDCGSW